MTQLIKRASAGLLSAAVLWIAAGSVPAAFADSRAEAGFEQYAHHHYTVYYHCHGWRYYGCYGCRAQAQSVAYSLQCQGYNTSIVCGH